MGQEGLLESIDVIPHEGVELPYPNTWANSSSGVNVQYMVWKGLNAPSSDGACGPWVSESWKLLLTTVAAAPRGDSCFVDVGPTPYIRYSVGRGEP